jgi:outer membrane lipoprotein-sorting protein
MFWILWVLVGATPLDGVREAFKGRKGFEVRFEQEVKQELFPEQPSLARGFVSYEKPNQLRWVYESPDQKEIVFKQGKGFILRGKEKEEIPNARALGVEESFGFLWGEMDLKQFRVKKLGEGSVEIRPLDSEKAQFEKMQLRISKSKIDEARVFDRLGGESRIQFKDWKWK